ncbi:MAG TPA: DMT family transporter [Candidatus Dormibacteraeota bacterium]|nr:DMT family transporter [Candidatus Dormibacteraeota bacterium]
MIQKFLRKIPSERQIVACHRTSPRRLAVYGLVLAAAAWGISFVVTRGAVATYPVVGFLFLRFAVGGGVLAGLALRSPTARGSWAVAPKGMLLLLGAVLAIAYLAQTLGLELGAAPGVAAALTSLVVVITPALEWALRGQAPDSRVLAGALLAVGGTVLVCLTVPAPNAAAQSHLVLGLGLELIAAAAFSVQVVLVGQLGHRVPAVALGAWQLLALAAVLGLAVPFSGGLALPSARVLADIVFCGLAASAFAFAVQAAAQQQLSSSLAALIMAIEPGIAMVGGAVVGMQALTPLALLGLALLSGGSAAPGADRALRLARHVVSPLGRLWPA